MVIDATSAILSAKREAKEARLAELRRKLVDEISMVERHKVAEVIVNAIEELIREHGRF